MRRACRTDSNQFQIVTALREAGCSVQPLHTVGAGVPDLLVGCVMPSGDRLNYLLEVKDGGKPPSKRQLTADEQSWHKNWKGQVNVITSIKEALELIGHA
jgi:hypothetical protein